MPEKLKPCPFCGGEAKFITVSNNCTDNGVGFEFAIECVHCRISFPKRYRVEFVLDEEGEIKTNVDHREKALCDWNRRADNEV